MKKNYLLGMALIASLSFYSCDKEVVYVQDGNGVESVADGAQIITLQVENGGDGLATRAGRPLYSAEAKQDIQNVKLWICDNTGKKVVYVKEISNWNTDGSTVYTTGGHGRQTTIELKDADKLAAGTYQIYAVGYSATSDYDLTKVTEVKKTEEGEGKYTFSENMVLPIKGDATNKIGEEIFAGQMELTVEQGKGFKKPIVLNRQVAGAFAYVKDIPYMEGAKYLKLVASAQNQSLVLGNFNSFDLTGNGSGNGKNVKYVVNGTNGKSGSDTCVISTIDLNKWFTAIKDEDGDNLIDAGKNWKNPHRPSGSPAAGTYPTFQKGSAFGGEFVIPFAHVDGKQTLTLQLTNAGGKVLRSWKVNLGSTDVQLNQTITYWNSNWDSTITDTSANTYSLVRNHLYGIGTRMNDEANPGKPGVDPDPNPENPNDKPESLNNKQELVLKVNDNWEVIHGMELD